MYLTVAAVAVGVMVMVTVATKGEEIAKEKKTGRINNNRIVRDMHLAWSFGQVQRRRRRRRRLP